MARRLASVAVLWSVAILCGGAGASAVVVPVRHVPTAGPVFAGSGIAWADNDAQCRVALLESGIARPAVRRIQVFGPDRFGDLYLPSLAASGQRVALGVNAYACPASGGGPGSGEFAAYAGSPGSALVPLTPCSVPPDVPMRAVDVDGDRVLYRSSDCNEQPTITTELTDLSVSPPAQHLLPGLAEWPRLAGRYAAFEEVHGGTDELWVYDVSSDRAVVRIPARQLRDGVADLALRPDGTVAVTLRASRGRQSGFVIGWASPARPRLHQVPLPFAGHYAVRWSGSELAVLSSPRYTSGTLANGTLQLVSLDGRVRHVVARGVVDRLGSPLFDVRSKLIAYVTASCNGAQLHVQAVNASTRTFRVPAQCPLTLPHSILRADGATVRVVFSCRGQTGLCSTTGRGVLSTVGRRPRVIGHEESPGRTATNVTFFALDALGRRLTRGRRIPARVSITVGDPPEVVSVPTLTNLQRRSAAVVIVG